MEVAGRIEVLSRGCAIGWAKTSADKPSHVYARLHGQVIAFTRADIIRADLLRSEETGTLSARAFVLVFEQEVEPEDLDAVEIRCVERDGLVERGAWIDIDRNPPMRVFILGSPRSGTSELGDTLAKVMGLPWLGEGHAAPLFAAAADALTGSDAADQALVRLLAKQNFRSVAIAALKRAYYFIHASSSFLDKTPGVPMIRAAPFLAECFPDAKFIFLKRNGISNVLSRMVKFGGNFSAHCADWVAAMQAWVQVRDKLPSSLEIRQEDMLESPETVGAALAAYLSIPGKDNSLVESLRRGCRERTGAGIGRATLADTGWSNSQIEQFRSICGPTMVEFGYMLPKDLQSNI